MEEEEEQEVEDIKINKVFKTCQNLTQDMEKVQKIITKDDDVYGNR